MDFAIGLVSSVINLPDRQVKFFEEFKLQKYYQINLLIKTFLGLVEMMFGLVNVSFSLPEWQAVKMTFFAPCIETAQHFLTQQSHSCNLLLLPISVDIHVNVARPNLLFKMHTAIITAPSNPFVCF